MLNVKNKLNLPYLKVTVKTKLKLNCGFVNAGAPFSATGIAVGAGPSGARRARRTAWAPPQPPSHSGYVLAALDSQDITHCGELLPPARVLLWPRLALLLRSGCAPLESRHNSLERRTPGVVLCPHIFDHSSESIADLQWNCWPPLWRRASSQLDLSPQHVVNVIYRQAEEDESERIRVLRGERSKVNMFCCKRSPPSL